MRIRSSSLATSPARPGRRRRRGFARTVDGAGLVPVFGSGAGRQCSWAPEDLIAAPASGTADRYIFPSSARTDQGRARRASVSLFPRYVNFFAMCSSCAERIFGGFLREPQGERREPAQVDALRNSSAICNACAATKLRAWTLDTPFPFVHSTSADPKLEA